MTEQQIRDRLAAVRTRKLFDQALDRWPGAAPLGSISVRDGVALAKASRRTTKREARALREAGWVVQGAGAWVWRGP